MRTAIVLAVIAAGMALATTAQAQQRSSGDWWRVGESRVGASNRRVNRRAAPRVRGFRARRNRYFDPLARYDFAGTGLPTWAVRAFQPSNRR